MLTNEEVLALQEAIMYIDIFKQVMLCLLICGAKIIEISIQSVKTVCMVKGERKIATLLAFIECMIWGIVVSSIITSLQDNYFLLFSYCFGYAAGIFIGSMIENKIALGTSNIQVIVNNKHIEAVENFLKDNGHGYTIIDGHGSKEAMHVVIMVLPRKDVKNIMSEIRRLCDNKVFIISSEVSKFVGGYGVRK